MICLTEEQKNIIETLKNDDKVVKINAFAGSGKSSTLLEVVKEIRKTDNKSKILYLVFNKNMVEEAKSKFGIFDVECYTTHSFALRRFTAVKKEQINILNNLDFGCFMKIKNMPKYKKSFIRYATIKELFDRYCLTYDSMDKFCDNLKKEPTIYSDKLDDIKLPEINFFEDLYNYFTDNNMYMHGMYLKEYACSCKDKISQYDYILLDEAQDVNLMMLNMIKRFDYSKKMYIVGDSKQAIYQFMACIDTFKKLEGETLPLSTSFRFNKPIANLANEVLASHYSDFDKNIKAFHNNKQPWSKTEKTIIFRTNYTMFEYATNLVTNLNNVKVKFMDCSSSGNLDKFDDTFAEMLYFYYKLLESLKSKNLQEFQKRFKIKPQKSIDNFVKIAEKANIALYGYLSWNKHILPLDLNKYFSFFVLNERNIIDVLEAVRASENCENPDKTFTLTSAHRSKGLEWDDVKIAPDLWSLSSDSEVNLLYVAITRARYNLDYKAIEHLLEKKGIFVDEKI